MPHAEVVRLLDLPQSGIVVDFGAGTGVSAIPIAAAYPDLTVYAVDEQPAMLERLQAAAGPAAPPNLIAAGSDVVPALAGRAARVLVLDVLHEAGDAALASIRSLLAPGGYALFIDWRADLARPVGPPAAHVFTVTEAEARLQAAGFTTSAAGVLDFPYHFALFARSNGVEEQRAATLSRLRAMHGTRVALETAHGTHVGYVLVDWVGDGSVTVLLVDAPGDTADRALVLDVDAISSIRGA